MTLLTSLPVFLLLLLSPATASKRLNPSSSSVWCQGSHRDHRHCSFRNLCYSPLSRQFLFFLGVNSTLSGLDDESEQRQLARLSSVEGEDDAYMDYAILPAAAAANYTLVRSDDDDDDRPVLIVKRFRPHDVLHALHDDLLPIYATMRHLCLGDLEACLSQYRLAFLDDYDSGSAWLRPLYDDALEGGDGAPKPLILPAIRAGDESEVVCFSRAVIGLDTDSRWYDHAAQRPIENENLRAAHLDQFRRQILNSRSPDPYDSTHVQQQQEKQQHQPGPTAVWVTNSDTFMDPSADLTQLAADAWRRARHDNSPGRVDVLDFSVHSARHIFRTLSSPRVSLLLGVHGPHMVSALFLSPGAHVVEIFPLTLHPASFTFTEALCRKMGLVYHAWRGEGGEALDEEVEKLLFNRYLGLLSRSAAEAIVAAKEIRPVSLEDPAYLYHVHKPFHVRGKALAQFLGAIEEIESQRVDLEDDSDQLNQWLLPSKAFDFSCRGSVRFGRHYALLKWHAPLNAAHFSSLRYDVLVQAESRDDPTQGARFVRDFSTRETSVEVEVADPKQARWLKVWVMSAVDDGSGGELRTEATFRCDLDFNSDWSFKEEL